jgi:hypothetical protein
MVVLDGGGLHDAELVAFGVAQHTPPPAGLHQGGENGCAEADEAVHLKIEIGYSDVEVNPVLAGLGFLDSLECDVGSVSGRVQRRERSPRGPGW